MCKALAILTISHLARADRFKKRPVTKELKRYYDIVKKKRVFPQLTFCCGEESFDIKMRKIEAFQTTFSNVDPKNPHYQKRVSKIQFSLEEDRQSESRAKAFAEDFKKFLRSLKGERKTKKTMAEIQRLEKDIARIRERIDPDSPVTWQKVENYWSSAKLEELEKKRQKLAALERRIVIKFPEDRPILDKELLTKILTGKKTRDEKVAEWEKHTALQNSCYYDCNRLCLSGDRLTANYSQNKKILELTFTYAGIQGTKYRKRQRGKTINDLKQEIVKAQEKSRLSRHDKSKVKKVKQLIQKVEEVEGQTWHCANTLERIQKMKESLATPVKKGIAQANALASQKFQPARKFKTYEMKTDTPTLIDEIGEMNKDISAMNSNFNDIRKRLRPQKARPIDVNSQHVRAIAEAIYGKKGAQELLSARTDNDSSFGARRRLKRLSQGEMCK